jgi:hypothetical protein
MIAMLLALTLAGGECASLPTPEALRRSAGEGAVTGGKLGLLLPRDWPAPREQLTLYAYEAEALPTGVVRYRYRGPSHRVVLSGGVPTVIPLASAGKVLGTLEASPSDEPRAAAKRRAEAVLVSVVYGCASAEAARPELEGYLQWLDGESYERAHLLAIGHPFLAWLCAGKSTPAFCAKARSPD